MDYANALTADSHIVTGTAWDLLSADATEREPCTRMSPARRLVLETPDGDVTGLLHQAADGNQNARDRLFRILLPELRRMAAGHMAHERPGHTLSPTGLVNEAFVRFARQRTLPTANRLHFLGLFSLTMRRVLVDHWKKKKAVKSGGQWQRVPLGDVLTPSELDEETLIAVHEALRRLEHENPRPAKVVELRFFCGLTNPEIADCLEISLSTVEADWRFARAWLQLQLQDR